MKRNDSVSSNKSKSGLENSKNKRSNSGNIMVS
jgi:hypothetical protein